MQEYLFNKEELRRLIDRSANSQNRIAVRVNLSNPQETIWARAVRFEAGITTESSTDTIVAAADDTTTADALPTQDAIFNEEEATTAAAAPTNDGSVPGCPNPPGC